MSGCVQADVLVLPRFIRIGMLDTLEEFILQELRERNCRSVQLLGRRKPNARKHAERCEIDVDFLLDVQRIFLTI